MAPSVASAPTPIPTPAPTGDDASHGVRYFGIRHHGPGGARSLINAFTQWQPDCVLIEGPPEGQALLHLLQHPELRPPVALLVYEHDDPSHAAFYPFAVFSPEWQALQWAAAQHASARLIDLPQTHSMALRKAAQAQPQDDTPDRSQDSPSSDTSSDTSGDTSCDTCADMAPADPLDWLAHAAGYSDGESWWNHLIEERSSHSDSDDVFAAIAHAMTVLRAEISAHGNTPDHSPWRSAHYARREALREAWMRQCIRQAQKEGFARIAVVCGAWHVPALQEPSHYSSAGARADAALLKGLPKAKVHTTWVPWTYKNLALHSGYGAGITAPGWYEHLWRSATHQRTIGWLAQVAQLLRSKDLDCSSAHIIEATRLAQALAALRGRSQPGLTELDEAIVTVICMGDAAALRLIEEELTTSDRLGSVPADVPQVPLQCDIERQQKALRLKPEVASKLLALDLRKDTDLARSHFLHRLRLLGITWGVRAQDAQRNRGTFRESWQLQWEPQLAVRIIEASIYGATLEQAATARLQHSLTSDTPLPDIAQAIDDALLANLPALVATLMQALAQHAATTGDVKELLQALVPLAQVQRYGSVRQTDAALLGHIIDNVALRAAIGLPVACMSLNEDAATALHALILTAHEALLLRSSSTEHGTAAGHAAYDAWLGALRALAHGDAGAAVLRGMACRLLFDAKQLDSDAAVAQFHRNLSVGAPPADVAAWLDGFVNRQALVLLHDDALWGAVDAWLTHLGEAQFQAIVPLVRRSFANFSRSERQSLGEKARRSTSASSHATHTTTAGAAGTVGAPPWNAHAAVQALPVLNQILGFNL